jgi:hypothetical protein
MRWLRSLLEGPPSVDDPQGERVACCECGGRRCSLSGKSVHGVEGPGGGQPSHRALAALVAVLLLAGCAGSGQPKDKYVGTWQEIGHPGTVVVIAKDHKGYVATWVEKSQARPPLRLFARGGELWSGPKSAQPEKDVLRYSFQVVSGVDMWATQPGGWILHMFSVSDRTAVPTPLPS